MFGTYGQIVWKKKMYSIFLIFKIQKPKIEKETFNNFSERLKTLAVISYFFLKKKKKALRRFGTR